MKVILLGENESNQSLDAGDTREACRRRVYGDGTGSRVYPRYVVEDGISIAKIYKVQASASYEIKSPNTFPGTREMENHRQNRRLSRPKMKSGPFRTFSTPMQIWPALTTSGRHSGQKISLIPISKTLITTALMASFWVYQV